MNLMACVAGSGGNYKNESGKEFGGAPQESNPYAGAGTYQVLASRPPFIPSSLRHVHINFDT